MNSLKTVGISLVAALVVVLVVAPMLSKTQIVKQTLGSVASPDVQSPYLRWGGVPVYQSAMDITATSSVLCSFPNPTGATTTVERLTLNITANPMLGAMTFDVATSSTGQGATTSPSFAKAVAIADRAQKPFVWTPGNATTTNAGVWGYDGYLKTGESPLYIGPSDNVIFKLASGTPGTYASYLTGRCTASFPAM